MAKCEHTSKRVGSEAAKLMKDGRKKVRSVSASALRARPRRYGS